MSTESSSQALVYVRKGAMSKFKITAKDEDGSPVTQERALGLAAFKQFDSLVECVRALVELESEKLEYGFMRVTYNIESADENYDQSVLKVEIMDALRVVVNSWMDGATPRVTMIQAGAALALLDQLDA